MSYADYLSPETIEPTIWASLIALEQKAVAYADSFTDTGNLRNSITIATSERKKQHGSSPDGLDEKPDVNTGVIGTACEYAAAQEFGRPDIPMYPADPYLRPALDELRAQLGQITGKELKKQLELYAIRHPYKKA